jgi:hypothetical protein
MMRWSVLILAVVMLAGCVQTRAASQYRAVGMFNGQAVELAVTGAEASDSGVDPVAALHATVAALRGDVAGVSAAIAAQPPPTPQIAPEAVAAAVVKATPPPPPPATVTGNGMMDSLLAALAAYLAGKGGVSAYRKLKTPKA